MLQSLVRVTAALAVTICLETLICVLFRFRGRALGAVAAINLVTNPLLNLILLLLCSPSAPRWSFWLTVGVLEIAVIFVEWRMLVWILGTTVTTSRRLMIVSGVMNTTSATLGTLLLASVM